MPEVPALYDFAEAASRLGVKESWLRRRTGPSGSIPHRKLGNSVRFTDDDLAEIVESMRVTPIEAAATRPTGRRVERPSQGRPRAQIRRPA